MNAPKNDPIELEELLDHPMLRPAAIRAICAVAKLLKLRKEEGPPLTSYEQMLYQAVRKLYFDIPVQEKRQAFDLPDKITAEQIQGKVSHG
jgi:hypothetical protein